MSERKKDWRMPFWLTLIVFFTMFFLATMNPILANAMFGIQLWGVLTIALIIWWIILEVLDECQN